MSYVSVQVVPSCPFTTEFNTKAAPTPTWAECILGRCTLVDSSRVIMRRITSLVMSLCFAVLKHLLIVYEAATLTTAQSGVCRLAFSFCYVPLCKLAQPVANLLVNSNASVLIRRLLGKGMPCMHRGEQLSLLTWSSIGHWLWTLLPSNIKNLGARESVFWNP